VEVVITATPRSITATGIKPLTLAFNQSERRRRNPHRHHKRPNRDFRATARTDQEKDITMKKFGFATIIASGLAAAVLGLAGPAQADIGHHDWVNTINQHASAPQVDTSVHQSR
jgi:hypothetical protein